MSTRRLIVNADDFGMSKEVNEGIMLVTCAVRDLHLGPRQPARSDERVSWRGAPAVGVGLHLNCTLGRSVAPFHEVPSLVDGPAFL